MCATALSEDGEGFDMGMRGIDEHVGKVVGRDFDGVDEVFVELCKGVGASFFSGALLFGEEEDGVLCSFVAIDLMVEFVAVQAFV